MKAAARKILCAPPPFQLFGNLPKIVMIFLASSHTFRSRPDLFGKVLQYKT